MATPLPTATDRRMPAPPTTIPGQGHPRRRRSYRTAPQFVPGNPTGDDLNGELIERKLEPVGSGIHTLGDFIVRVTVRNTSLGQVLTTRS